MHFSGPFVILLDRYHAGKGVDDDVFLQGGLIVIDKGASRGVKFVFNGKHTRSLGACVLFASNALCMVVIGGCSLVVILIDLAARQAEE